MIIGLVGLPCSGSDAIGKILVGKGFIWLSYSDVLREELRKQKKEITRETMQEIGNEIRRKEGAGALSKRLLAKTISEKNYVFGTIRNPAEVSELRKRSDFFLIGINASSSVRFARMTARNRERDPQNYEEFLALDAKELGEGQSENGLRIGDCFPLVDSTIINDSSLEELQEKVEAFLKKCE